MDQPMLSILQCGAFLLIPISTFSVGLWLIMRFIGLGHRFSFVLLALLIGLVFFEATLIGILMDARADPSNIAEYIRTSGLIGLGTFVAVIVFTPIYHALVRIFK